jgi:hypothetical protein
MTEIRGFWAELNKNHHRPLQTGSASLTTSSRSEVVGNGPTNSYVCHRQEINVEMVPCLTVILSLQSPVRASKFVHEEQH